MKKTTYSIVRELFLSGLQSSAICQKLTAGVPLKEHKKVKSRVYRYLYGFRKSRTLVVQAPEVIVTITAPNCMAALPGTLTDSELDRCLDALAKSPSLDVRRFTVHDIRDDHRQQLTY